MPLKYTRVAYEYHHHGACCGYESVKYIPYDSAHDEYFNTTLSNECEHPSCPQSVMCYVTCHIFDKIKNLYSLGVSEIPLEGETMGTIGLFELDH